MRPVITGWYAELSAVAAPAPQTASGGTMRVTYDSGAGAFAGATYDPTSHYRAAAVFAFHQEQLLAPERLRQRNLRQIAVLKDRFERLDLDPGVAYVEPMPETRRGGFLAIRTPQAASIAAALRADAVFVDARGDILRVGPAPFVRDDQLITGVAAVGAHLRPNNARTSS